MSPGRGKGTAQAACPDSNLARSSYSQPLRAGSLRAGSLCTAFLRARPLGASALTWTPTGNSEANGQHAGQGWNVSLLWLDGDSGPPGSGEHEGMYGGGCNHTNIDLGLLEGHPLPLALGSMPPAGVKLSSFFKLFGSETRLETLG